MSDKELLKTIQNDIENIDICIEMCDTDEGIDFLLKDFMSRLNPKMPKNNKADTVEKNV